MEPMTEYDQGLVQAYREAYREVADATPRDNDFEVLAVLRRHGVVTERQAEIIGFGAARADLKGDGDA